MAKVIFITICDKGALGVRYISSLLKKAGHKTSIIYFKEYNQAKKKDIKDQLKNEYKGLQQVWHEGISDEGEEMIFAYPPEVTERELELLSNLIQEEKPDIIGVSLSASYFPVADIITTKLKEEFQGLVLWGGAGPSTNPEEMISFCDILAIGEAEYSIVDLVNKVDKGQEYKHISNLWINTKEGVIKNSTNPLILELDALPYPDFSFESKFLISNNTLVKECKEINNFPGVYTIMTARGCPFSCSFCINDYYRKLYRGEKYVRRRSVRNVIGELVYAKKELGVSYVTFYDEVFTFDKKWIKEFSEEYTKQVALPFWCNIYPTMVDEDIITWLKHAGAESVTLGIQSGSEQVVKEMYTRDAPNLKILAAAKLLHKYKIRYYVDVITESPFEREDDCKKTLSLLLQLPKPFTIATLSKLSLFENLYVTQLAKKQNNPKLEKEVFNFYNKLYLLTTFTYLPRKVIRALSQSSYFKRHPEKLNIFFMARKKYNFIKQVVKKIVPLHIWLKIKQVVNI